jgi:hypothetical protein
MLKKFVTEFMDVPLFENFPHGKIEKCLTKLLEFPTAVMGNPNRFEGQSIDFYYSLSRLFCEIAIFQSVQKSRSLKLKGPGPQVAMAV